VPQTLDGPVAKRRTQAERRGESERALVEAAISVVAKEGVSAATFEAICGRAGYSRGLVTQRFGSKDGLIEMVINHLHERHEQLLTAAGIDALPGFEAVLKYVDLYLRDLSADGQARAYFMLLSSAVAEPVTLIDPTRRFATLAEGAGGDGEPLGPGVSGRVLGAIAAEVVGVCQRALEMTLDYVKDRRQFGVPVGSFQAVAHRCAHMLLHTESVRSTAYFAAWAADADPLRLDEAAALAAAAAATGGREVTAGAIQAHGGIGFTWEADVHWLYKRAEVDRALLGGASRHHAVLARAAARSRLAPTP